MSQADESSGSPAFCDQRAQQRIDELEMRVAFMEDTIDSLNAQLVTFTQDFALAKQAMQMMNRRLEQLQSGQADIRDSADEPPPPHY